MKSILLFSILIFSFNSFSQDATNATPRDTMKTFLKSMVKVKTGEGNKNANYKLAISTLDLRHYDATLKNDVGVKYANDLIKAFDKIKKVDYEKVPEKYDSPIWTFDKRVFEANVLEISLIQLDKKWFFSKATLDSLKFYNKALAKKNTIEGVKKLETFHDKVRGKLPSVFLNKVFLFENWQWIGLFFIIIIGFIVEKLSDSFISSILSKNIAIIKDHSKERLMKAVKPFGKILFVFTVMSFIHILDFNTESLAVIKRGLYILMSVMAIWLAHKVIELISFYSTQAAAKTDTKFDDILIPLITKTAYVLAYILGGILIMNSLTIDVTGLIAGLGIGGLAFAFAAKDMLANFFGSIMLVLDRPFDIGDVVIVGDIEGVVEEVGFRSTRIRTFYDSMITISNGDLMNKSINNLGKRRYRRLSTTLGVEYDTPPEKIEAFCEGIRQLIINHKWTRKDYFNVYFTNFGASSLDISIMVFWQTDDYTREMAEKHRLMIDILRLADEMEVNFAFPTQTIHMFNENTKTDSIKIENNQQFSAGKERAKQLAEKPLSLKNPRSNANDKNQFGDNDIGL